MAVFMNESPFSQPIHKKNSTDSYKNKLKKHHSETNLVAVLMNESPLLKRFIQNSKLFRNEIRLFLYASHWNIHFNN